MRVSFCSQQNHRVSMKFVCTGDDHGHWIDGPNPTPIMVARIGLFVGGELRTLCASFQIACRMLLKVARPASRKQLVGFQKGLIF